MKTNYHTHIYLCRHASGTVNDYVEKAIAHQYSEIGISDHGPLTNELMEKLNCRRMTLDEFYNIYLNDLAFAKFNYGDKIKVLSSIEIEYNEEMADLYPTFLNDLDYLVLGQHWIFKNNEYLSLYDVDYTASDLEIYSSTIKKALETGCFKIVAHPDLYMWSYKVWNENAKKCARTIIEAAIKNNAYLEFNANGVRRSAFTETDGSINYVYPRLEFWKLLKDEYDYDKILINDDCHCLDNLDDEYTAEARFICKKLKLKIKEKIEL